MERELLLDLVEDMRSAGWPVDRCASGRLFGGSLGTLAEDEECPAEVSVYVVFQGCESVQIWGSCRRHVSVAVGMAETFGREVLSVLPAPALSRQQ